MRWFEPDETTGLVHRTDLLAAGVHRSLIDRAVRRGALVPIQPGLYTSGGRPAHALDRARAVVLTVGGCAAIASHVTAARVHGLEVPDGGPEEVTIPRGERRPHRRGLRYHTSRLSAEDVDLVGGVPVTTVARTLVDLCRSLDDRTRAVWAVEQALARHRVTREELEAARHRLAGSPGLRRATAWLRAADARSGSPLETAGRLALVDAGLPVPDLQVRVVRADGRVAFLDLGYRERKVGIEFDGRSTHGMELAVFDDRDRENQVVATTWSVLRFSWFDVHQRCEHYVRTVAGALGLLTRAEGGGLS